MTIHKAKAQSISITASNGDVYEASRASSNDAWDINYPTGSDRFYGTLPELINHIKKTMDLIGGAL